MPSVFTAPIWPLCRPSTAHQTMTAVPTSRAALSDLSMRRKCVLQPKCSARALILSSTSMSACSAFHASGVFSAGIPAGMSAVATDVSAACSAGSDKALC